MTEWADLDFMKIQSAGWNIDKWIAEIGQS